MSHRTATFSLEKKLKREWIKMLRSGKYPQGKEYLFVDGSYCCLGLLCKANGMPDSKLMHYPFPQDVGFGADLDNVAAGNYNDEEYQWSVLYKGRMTPLTTLNDYEKLSFDQIADLVERYVPTH